MKRFIALIAAMFIITASLSSLSAQAYRFDFSGTIAESTFPTEFAIDSTFSGYLVLDFSLLDNPTFFDDAASVVSRTIIDGDLFVSGHDYNFATASAGFYLSVRFDPSDPDSRFDGYQDIGGTHLSLRGAQTPFSYEEGDAIPEHLLSGSFISGETLMVSAVQNEPFGEFTANGLVSHVTVTAIPEPSSTAWMVGAVALFATVTSRSRRK